MGLRSSRRAEGAAGDHQTTESEQRSRSADHRRANRSRLGYVGAVATAVATLVAIGFLWSIVLFFAAVFMRERAQEAGFGWALAGATVYLATFSDRLPGFPSGLRDIFDLLPGVTANDIQFASPTAVLFVLVVVYVIRIVIFYELFVDLADFDIDGDGEPDDVNDLVAPFLSYVAFSICTITALRGVYELSTAVTIVVAVAMLPLYYLTNFLRFLRPYLDVIYETTRSLVITVWQRIVDAVVLMIIGIGRAELARRGADVARIDARARDQRARTAARVAEAKARRRKAIAKLARAKQARDRPEGPSGPGPGASRSGSRDNPNR